MRKLNLYFGVLTVISLALLSCVEVAKPEKYQIINLYTDLPESFDGNSFREFGRKEHIQVHVFHQSSDEIIQLIRSKKWESGVDIVVLKNALDLLHLKSLSALQKPKNEQNYYQGLLIDPYVFRFPKDTVPLFNSYGQVFRSTRVKIDPSAIRDKKEWANLVGGLRLKYPKVLTNDMYNKLMRRDSLKEKDMKFMEILPYSTALNKDNITFPDQYYKGSVGKISGVALIKQSKYSYNAQLLYDYCKNQWWRDKLAKKMGLFPFIHSGEAKPNEPIIFQGLIKNQGFIKKIAL